MWKEVGEVEGELSTYKTIAKKNINNKNINTWMNLFAKRTLTLGQLQSDFIGSSVNLLNMMTDKIIGYQNFFFC